MPSLGRQTASPRSRMDQTETHPATSLTGALLNGYRSSPG